MKNKLKELGIIIHIQTILIIILAILGATLSAIILKQEIELKEKENQLEVMTEIIESLKE